MFTEQLAQRCNAASMYGVDDRYGQRVFVLMVVMMLPLAEPGDGQYALAEDHREAHKPMAVCDVCPITGGDYQNDILSAWMS